MTEENASPVPTTTDQEISPSTHRVKLYQLDIETNWVDKGTGFCTYQLVIEINDISFPLQIFLKKTRP
jgi:hypothetical protein